MAKKKLTLEDVLVPKEEIPYEVPENWCWSNINSISERFTDGDWILSSNFDDNGNVRVLQLADIGIGRFIDKSNRFLNESTFNELGCTEIYTGDLLISRMAEPIGRSMIVPKLNHKLVTAVDVSILTPNEKIVKKEYLNYLFNSNYFRESCEKLARGTTRLRITRKNLGLIPIPLPPVSEQERIVNRIEGLFEKIDKASELIDEARRDFEKRRAAILEKAFCGELTNTWREENGIGFSLEMKEFKDIATVKSNLVKPQEYMNYPHIAPDNIEKKTGRLLEYRTVEEDNVKSAKHKFYPSQILYSKIRPYLSKVVIVDFEGLCSADMYPIETELETKYLYWYMLSQKFLDYASNCGSRSVLPKINQKELGKIPVPVVTREEQKEVVKIIDKLIEAEKSVEQISDVSEYTDIIKKSILAKAFRGELS